MQFCFDEQYDCFSSHRSKTLPQVQFISCTKLLQCYFYHRRNQFRHWLFSCDEPWALTIKNKRKLYKLIKDCLINQLKLRGSPHLSLKLTSITRIICKLTWIWSEFAYQAFQEDDLVAFQTPFGGVQERFTAEQIYRTVKQPHIHCPMRIENHPADA